MPYFRPEDESQGRPITVRSIQRMKRKGEKIPVITAYDYPTARMIDAAGIPLILVGDSLGMVVLGYESTIRVTLDDMIHHARAVCRGAGKAFVTVDMPFMSFRVNDDRTVENAARLIQETGAQAVKLEGGKDVCATVERLVASGIPVMGHIGLLPQSIHTAGGYRIVGKTLQTAKKLVQDAQCLEQAGAFAIVLEGVPEPLARMISPMITVPTIGIGAGAGCDGQVQVVHDILGLYEGSAPKHARLYADVAALTQKALQQYSSDVRDGSFPSANESFSMDEQAEEELAAYIRELEGVRSDAGG